MPVTSYTDSSAAQIGLTTMFSVLATADIIGNAIVCLLIIKFQDMRVPLNYLILNLAVADIIVALFLVPRHIFIHSKNHPDGLTGTVLCKLLTGGTLTWIGLLVSVFTLVVIAFERYYAVVRTDAYQRQFTAEKLKIFVAIIWISAAIFNLPQLLTAYYSGRNTFCAEHWPRPWMLKANSLTWVIITGVTPICLMTVLYWRAVYTLWCQNAGDGDNAQQGREKIQKRITKMVATVSLVFALCWIPALTSLCVLSFSNPSQMQGYILQVITTALVISNCSANPVIYVLVSHRFRRHFMELVCCAGVSNTKVYPAPRGKRASGLPPVEIQHVSLADC